MHQHESRRIASVAQSGFAGVCSIYLAFFGIFLFLVAAGLIGYASSGGIEDNPNFQDDFFKHSREQSISQKNGMRIAGAILMVISLIMICTTIGLCIYVCKKVASDSTTHQSGNSGRVLVSGSAPPPAGYHTQTTGGATSYPMGPQPAAGYKGPPAGYPSQPGGYPNQPAGYPTQPAGYPPPQAGYPPQGGYPPAQPAAYPPPGAPGYGPAPTYPAGYPPAGTEPNAPPPPSYQEAVVNEKTSY